MTEAIRARGYANDTSAERVDITEEHKHDTPPQRTWVGLTDEEIDKTWRSVDHTIPYAQFRIDVAKAIEAKLKEKNNG